jgi:hypothetical protein
LGNDYDSTDHIVAVDSSIRDFSKDTYEYSSGESRIETGPGRLRTFSTSFERSSTIAITRDSVHVSDLRFGLDKSITGPLDGGNKLLRVCGL